MHTTNGWSPHNLPDLTGKFFVITGANSGLGFETARTLSQLNATIIMACRNESKAQRAMNRLRDINPNAMLHFQALDLSCLKSVNQASDALLATFPAIHCLINNAGIMACPYKETNDGFESQMATNYLGHFLLTSRLLPALEATGGRIIHLSSIVNRFAQINLQNFMASNRYNRFEAYAQSKLAVLLFNFELSKRLHITNSKISSIACHPGFSSTDLIQNSGTGLMQSLSGITAMFAQPPSKGAWSTLYACLSQEAKSGAYYGPKDFFELKGAVVQSKVRSQARQEEKWLALWDLSSKITKSQWSL